jgi:hypothetical protein
MVNKRKGPVVLGSLLGVLALGLIGWNVAQTPRDAAADHSHDAELSERELTAERQEETRQSVRDRLKTVDVDPEAVANAEKPTILIDDIVVYKPKPNDNSTVTQWYKDQARTAEVMEKNAAERR